jgi:hypothetical protein
MFVSFLPAAGVATGLLTLLGLLTTTALATPIHFLVILLRWRLVSKPKRTRGELTTGSRIDRNSVTGDHLLGRILRHLGAKSVNARICERISLIADRTGAIPVTTIPRGRSIRWPVEIKGTRGRLSTRSCIDRNGVRLILHLYLSPIFYRRRVFLV